MQIPSSVVGEWRIVLKTQMESRTKIKSYVHCLHCAGRCVGFVVVFSGDFYVSRVPKGLFVPETEKRGENSLKRDASRKINFYLASIGPLDA